VKIVTVLSLLILAGCSTAPPTPPIVFEVKDSSAFIDDFALCSSHALEAKRRVSVSSIGVAGARSGLSTAPTAAINPLAPAIGAVAGATSEALNELNVLGHDAQRLTVRCMERKGDKSGAYFVLDPDQN
jgi:hypothetical protein